MRVCFISFEYPPEIIGGAGTYAKTLVDGLKARDVDVLTITRGNGNDNGQRICRIPTPDMPYLRRFFFIKPAISLLHKLNRLSRFDVVHFNEPHLILGKLDLPTVCTFHCTQVNEAKLRLSDSETLMNSDVRDLIFKNPIGGMCDIFTAHVADRIICPSPHLARLVRSYCFAGQDKICVIPNGIDLEAFDSAEEYEVSVLHKYDLERDNYLLFIGRLSSLKGVQYLIRAFEAVKRDYANLKLVIVGRGDFEAHLKSIACGLEDVVFTGYIGSLGLKKLLYKNCVAVIVPSLYEGLPMVVLEAMACEKVVIGSNTGGIPLLVRHGKNGFLAKPRDSKSFENFVRILLEDKRLRKNMGFFGRRLVEREFTTDIMIEKTLGVYNLLS